MSSTTWGLLVAVFVACFVEAVEATTIVMAVGFTRSWRSALAGVGAALALLTAVTSAFGYALATWMPVSALQLVIGGLLLIFGLQWLRKAILRSAGRKAMHDEDKIYATEVRSAKDADVITEGGVDMFSFIVAFKGTFLEGMEVVFIVITFGLSAHNVPAASLAAVTAALVVVALAIAAKRPLAMIPENRLKYGVALLLASFGSFWAVEGTGTFRHGRASIAWPGNDVAIVVLIAVWFVLTRILIAALRRVGQGPRSRRSADLQGASS